MRFSIPVLFLTSLFFLSSRDVGAFAQTSTASWLFPLNDGLIINYIDTVVLQWKSNYATPFMQMWCQNGAQGNNVVQGSNFNVSASGNYSYVLSNDDPSQTSFNVACHAQLATAQNGGGVDDPVGITFVSITGVDAKTFSLSTTSTTSSAATRSSSSSSSPTSSPSSSATSSVASNTGSPSRTNIPSSDISSEAKVGIGVGVAVVAIAILAAIIWLFLRKRKSLRISGGPEIPELGDERMRHELMAPHGQQELEVKRDVPRIYEMAAQP